LWQSVAVVWTTVVSSLEVATPQPSRDRETANRSTVFGRKGTIVHYVPVRIPRRSSSGGPRRFESLCIAYLAYIAPDAMGRHA
jgi:hypothetical protein